MVFGRRRGSSAQPPVNRSTMSAAAVAASQAYINKASQQNASLSSAAAAAALRSHTTTPEPVGNLQTKRMMRRGSVSSVASGSVVGGPTATRPGLQRANSSGSMTERTFRGTSPSPSRLNGTRSPPVTAPPVPALPKTLRSGPPKRPSSTEPPERVMSPTPQNNRRSASVDKVNLRSQGMRGGKRLSDVPELVTEGAPARRESVNFSRPRVGSPEPSPVSPSLAQRSNGDRFAAAIGSASDASPSVMSPSALTQPKTRPPPVQTAQEMEDVMVFDPASRTFVKQARPKATAEPPSPIVDNTPALKPGDYDPATRSIVPMPRPARTASSQSVTSQADSNATPTKPLQPPPRNPARLSPDQSPTASPRPGGFLHKQPSMVREDPDAEREAEEGAPIKQSRSVSNQVPSGPSKTYASTPTHQRSTSLDVPSGGSNRGRGGSLSPSRSTRFSVTPITEGTRHEPHRGVSPAKSAMKHSHSPSSSIRTSSPVATFSPPAVPQSDMSDATSMTSVDGSAVGGKKRRSVRVSFDETPQEAPVPPLPAATTTQKAVRPEITSDDEDGMGSRPALPSFGSVRRNKVQNEVAEKVTESPPYRAQTSSEQVAPTTVAPVAPEVISKTAPPVEAEEPAASKPSEPVPAINLSPPTPALDEAQREFGTDDEAAKHSDSQDLQSLAAGVIFYGDESDDSRSRGLAEKKPVVVRKDSDADEYSDAPETQNAAQGFASLDAIVESPVTSPVKATAPVMLPDSPTKAGGEKASPTGDWTAATSYWSKLNKQQKAQHEKEHLSSDDDGAKQKRSFFRRNKNRSKDIPAPVTAAIAAATAPAEKAPESPKATRAPAVQPTSTAPPEQTVAPVVVPAPAAVSPQPAKSKPAPASPSIATTSPQPVKSVPSNAAQPLKPALKNSMRSQVASDDEGVHMPRTMRGNDGPTGKTRPKSASVSSRTDYTKSVRPASMSQFSESTQPGPKQAQRPAPVAASSYTASKLGKKYKDDSDSESSFRKKKRSSSAANGGGYSMRRSMRAGSIDSTQRVTSPEPSGRGPSALMRSLSPSSVTSGRESLRQSLRGGPPDAGARTLRGSKPAPKPTSMTNRFKSRFVDSDDEDDAPRAAPRTYRSRFVDSDEDDTIQEELTPVRGIPRRKGQEDGDSTDLDDESDARGSPSKRKSRNVNAIVPSAADVDKAMDAARRKLGMAEPAAPQHNAKATQQEGQALQQGTLRGRDRENDKVLIPDLMLETGSAAGTPKKKRGFMDNLLKRNKHSSHSVTQVDAPASPAAPMPKLNTTPQSTPQKAQEQSPASPSAAKLVRRSSNQPPRLQRGNSGLSTATAPASHGRSTSDEHWPLPPPIPKDRFDSYTGRDGAERPQTSDEALQSTRPAERPQNRRSFSARVGFTDEAITHSERDGSEAGGDAVYSQRTGRKKRFGLLRRAFGLYD